MMMPLTPLTVSATAGLQALVFLIWLMVTESGHVAFGNCVAEATPAAHSIAATARKRVNILLMSDPLVAGGRYERETRSGGLAVCWRGSSVRESPASRGQQTATCCGGDVRICPARMVPARPDKSKEFRGFRPV